MSAEAKMRLRERAYLSINHLDSIAEALSHVGQCGSQSRAVASKVERAEKIVRDAVTAAYYEIEKITASMQP